jgi:AraC-like DNA-binding protein
LAQEKSDHQADASSQQDGLVRLATADLPERDRLAIWHDVYARKLFNLEVEPLGDQPFNAEVTMRRLAECGITSGWRTAAHYRITKAHLQRASDTIMFLTILSGRARSAQRQREVMTPAGEAVTLASSDTAEMTLLDNGRYLGVYLPRAMLAPLVPNLEPSLARPLCADPIALKLFTSYAAALQSIEQPLTPALQHSVTLHLCDLVASVIGASPDAAQAADGRGVRAARLHAIKRDILRNLNARDLSAETVAVRQGISPSYVRRLLESEGTSFGDLVLHLRLARAYRMLGDPRELHRPIGSIAFDVGFGDLSYFNRTFRRLYRATPSEIRARILDR